MVREIKGLVPNTLNRVLMGGICYSLAVTALAEGSPQVVESGLFSLSLSELMSVQVVSKEEEPISNSPGIVSVYQADQLQRLGLHSLEEFLHFVPSIEINEALNGSKVVQIRGLPSRSNQKILFLINGTPYWSPENGDIPLLGLPLMGIERIEVIRGPGSVIYGTNASAGVVNVIMREGDGVSAQAWANDEQKYNGSLYVGHTFENEIDFTLSLEVQQDEGYQYSVENAFSVDPSFSFPETANGELTRKEELYSLFSKVNWQDFSLTMQAYKEATLGDLNGSLVSETDYEKRGTLVSARYQKDFGTGKLELYSDWNRFYRQADVENILAFFFVDGDGKVEFDNDGGDNERFRQGISWQHVLADNFSITAGMEYEERSIESQKYKDDVGGANVVQITQPPINFPVQLQSDGSILLIEDASSQEKSAFIQADYELEEWRFVGGGRYIDNSEGGEAFSPRGAVVYKISESESLKLLYSQGFNSPTFTQSSGTNSFGMPQNNDIEAETIDTWDLAYTKTSGELHYVLSAFKTEAHNLIANFNNSDEVIRRSGFEFEMQYSHRNWDVYSGFTYIHQGNDDLKDEYAAFSSQWLLKAGVAYQYVDHSVGLSLRSAGPREGVSSSHLLNMSYVYNVHKNLSFFGTATNLLDDDSFQPDVRGLNDRVMQSESNFGGLIGLRYEL